jgi:hypothetical protein
LLTVGSRALHPSQVTAPGLRSLTPSKCAVGAALFSRRAVDAEPRSVVGPVFCPEKAVTPVGSQTFTSAERWPDPLARHHPERSGRARQLQQNADPRSLPRGICAAAAAWNQRPSQASHRQTGHRRPRAASITSANRSPGASPSVLGRPHGGHVFGY